MPNKKKEQRGHYLSNNFDSTTSSFKSCTKWCLKQQSMCGSLPAQCHLATSSPSYHEPCVLLIPLLWKQSGLPYLDPLYHRQQLLQSRAGLASPPLSSSRVSLAVFTTPPLATNLRPSFAHAGPCQNPVVKGQWPSLVFTLYLKHTSLVLAFGLEWGCFQSLTCQEGHAQVRLWQRKQGNQPPVSRQCSCLNINFQKGVLFLIFENVMLQISRADLTNSVNLFHINPDLDSPN